MRKLLFLLISAGVLGGPQVLQPVKAQSATTAVIEAFADHDIVMLAEWHADKQEHEWLRHLVSTPAFADRVDDIVMEIGNSLYQKSQTVMSAEKTYPSNRSKRLGAIQLVRLERRRPFTDCFTRQYEK